MCTCVSRKRAIAAIGRASGSAETRRQKYVVNISSMCINTTTTTTTTTDNNNNNNSSSSM